jgi:hypothetical protein
MIRTYVSHRMHLLENFQQFFLQVSEQFDILVIPFLIRSALRRKMSQTFDKILVFEANLTKVVVDVETTVRPAPAVRKSPLPTPKKF